MELENGEFMRKDGKPHQIKELEAFLQTWLFFGLLRECLGELEKEDFILREGKVPHITTAKLKEKLEKWRDQVKEEAKTEAHHRRMISA